MCEDRRSASLDAGNVKLTYNAFLEKAESKDKERVKNEAKKAKKLEHGFKALLSDHWDNTKNPEWEELKGKLEGDPAFEAVEDDEEKERLFKEFLKELDETCAHAHRKAGGEKKKKKKSKRSRSSSSEGSDREYRSKKSKKKERKASSDDSLSEAEVKPAKKSKKKKKGGSPVPPPPPTDDFSDSDSEIRGKSKSPRAESDVEEGELSEEELVQKRSALLKELQQND